MGDGEAALSTVQSARLVVVKCDVNRLVLLHDFIMCVLFQWAASLIFVYLCRINTRHSVEYFVVHHSTLIRPALCAQHLDQCEAIMFLNIINYKMSTVANKGGDKSNNNVARETTSPLDIHHQK